MAHTPGRMAYEEDVRGKPHYHDGTPRRTWEQLSEIARWSWERNPRPRYVRDRAHRTGSA